MLSHVSHAHYNGEAYDVVLTFFWGKYPFDRYIIGYHSSKLTASEILGLIKDKNEEEHGDEDVSSMLVRSS